jgi:hypothetical protein
MVVFEKIRVKVTNSWNQLQLICNSRNRRSVNKSLYTWSWYSAKRFSWESLFIDVTASACCLPFSWTGVATSWRTYSSIFEWNLWPPVFAAKWRNFVLLSWWFFLSDSSSAAGNLFHVCLESNVKCQQVIYKLCRVENRSFIHANGDAVAVMGLHLSTVGGTLRLLRITVLSSSCYFDTEWQSEVSCFMMMCIFCAIGQNLQLNHIVF